MEHLVENRSNIEFTIIRHSHFVDKYMIKLKCASEKEACFDWKSGMVLGAFGYLVSQDDYPRVYMPKSFVSKEEAEEFIDDLPEIVNFHKLQSYEN